MSTREDIYNRVLPTVRSAALYTWRHSRSVWWLFAWPASHRNGLSDPPL